MRFIVIAFVLLSPGVGAQTLQDTFDAPTLESGKWTARQIRPHQFDFLQPGRCGPTAITVITRDGDGGSDCGEGEDCQRAELRTAKAFWPPYDGRDVWFSFSFRVEGAVATSGSARTVIGQWKAPGDNSPFVAQRFDDGVFHVTVQDGEHRRVVATAQGEPERIVEAQRLMSGLNRDDPGVVRGITTLHALFRLRRNQVEVSQNLLSQPVLEALDDRAGSDSNVEQLAGLLSLPQGAFVPLFGELSFVAEPEKYLGAADLEIIPEANRKLPDPRHGWIDMVYRIRGGRDDNQAGPNKRGELEIWANGQKIVLVRGNLGYRLGPNPPFELIGPYFKFGMYRARVSGRIDYHFDEFSQAMSQDHLPAFCSKSRRPG